MTAHNIWQQLFEEAKQFKADEPAMAKLLDSSILNHKNFNEALQNRVANLLCNDFIIPSLFVGKIDQEISAAAARDLAAVRTRDPACNYLTQAFLSFKGFNALLCYRVAHSFWLSGNHLTSLVLQGRIGDLWGVDIHPAAKIGSGVMMDHANSIVIGETAVIGDDVSILHGVTLGGRGNEPGFDRHPKIGNNVFIGTHASVLGNIKIEDGATIAAGSIVLQDVPAGATAVGSPARIIETRTF